MCPAARPDRYTDYDVIVVGYGAAGAVAAIEAVDAGARVLLLEKMAQPGGLSILSAGGIRVCHNPDQALAYLHQTCGPHADPLELRALAEGMAELPAYLERLARLNGATVTLTPAPGNYDFPGCEAFGYAQVTDIPGFVQQTAYPQVHGTRQALGLFQLLADHVAARCQQGRLTVWLHAAAQRLLQDDQGSITGLRLTQQGQTRTLRAGAVILACGGFEASDAMKARHLIAQPVLNAGFIGNTGDGIRMAQAVGADLRHLWHYHGPYGLRHPDPAYPFGLYPKLLPMWTPGHPTTPLPRMAWIIVDGSGQRFANEYPPYLSDTGVRLFDQLDPVQGRYTRLPSFLIFDEAGRRLYPIGRSIAHHAGPVYRWSADNLAEVDNGLLTRADSLPELARLAGIDPESLSATVTRWNADCAAGHDRQFGRKPETLLPITRPPFYFARLWPMAINTQGGPVRDHLQRVIDAFGAPIAGLYSAGEIGSLFGQVYLAGGNLAECFVGGRTAGRQAALTARQASPTPVIPEQGNIRHEIRR